MLTKPSADTTATLAPSTPGAAATVVPTTVLTKQDAELLRDYKVFLEARQLEEKLFCRSCFQSGHEGSRIALAENQVAINCPDRMWFYQGPIPPVTRFDGMLAAKAHAALVLPGAGAIEITDEIPEEALFRTEAVLLRAYKDFLLKQHLLESVFCTTCWANSYHDGCRSFVTPEIIGIYCRHRRLTWKGQTV